MPDEPMLELFRVEPAEAGGATREIEVSMVLSSRRAMREQGLDPEDARIPKATHWQLTPDGTIAYSVASDLPADERFAMLSALASDLKALRWPGIAVESDDEHTQGLVSDRLAELGVNIAVAVSQPAEPEAAAAHPAVPPETVVELIGRDGVHYGFGIVEGYDNHNVLLRAGTGLIEGEVAVPNDRVDIVPVDLAKASDLQLRTMLDAAPSLEIADLIVGEVLGRASETDTDRSAPPAAPELTAPPAATAAIAPGEAEATDAATGPAAPAEQDQATATPPSATGPAVQQAPRRGIGAMFSRALSALKLGRAEAAPERPADLPKPGSLVLLTGSDGADRGLAIIDRYDDADRSTVVLRGALGDLAGNAPVPVADLGMEVIDPLAVESSRLRALIARPSSPEVSDVLLDAAMLRDAPPRAAEDLEEESLAATADAAPPEAAARPVVPPATAPAQAEVPPSAAVAAAPGAAAPDPRANPAPAPGRGFDAGQLDEAPAAPPAANRLADPAAPTTGGLPWTALAEMYRGLGMTSVLDAAAQVMTVTDPATGGTFRDDRRGLETDGSDPAAIGAMARAAQARGWKSIVVDGDPEFIAQVRERFKDLGIRVRVRGEEPPEAAHGKPHSNGRKPSPGKRSHQDPPEVSDDAPARPSAAEASDHGEPSAPPRAHEDGRATDGEDGRGGESARPVSRRERVPMDPDAAALVKDYVHFRNEAGMYNRLMQEAFQGYKNNPAEWTKGLKPEDRQKVAAAAQGVHSFEEMGDRAAKSIFRMKIITQHDEYPVYQGFKKERDTRVLKIAENMERHNPFLLNARITTKEFEADLQSARGAAQREKEKQERKQKQGGGGGRGNGRGNDRDE